ncbi:hypothetical protein ACS5UA_19795 [Brucella sp. RRSP16]|uniref:hypothetical protein n=1 Tax=Brucella sp. RRSP16 TaxID=3453707 RepID=UPI003FCD3227
MSILKRSFAGALTISILCMPAVASDHQWDVYENVHFGYSICYPADLLTAQPEADNGDGRKFTGKSGAELTVWGNYNALEQDMDTLISGLADAGATVIYRRATLDWAVVSARWKGNVFYAKLLLERNAADGVDIVRVFRLIYPANEVKTYNAVAARLAQCFKPTGRGIDDGLQPLPSDRHDERTIR